MLYILTHDDFDGYVSGWIAAKALADTDPQGVNESKPFQLTHVQYGQPVPYEFSKEDEVYILDFSYDRETTLSIKEQAGKLVVIDHHDTSAEALDGIEGCVFQKDGSAVELVWKYFHGEAEQPLLVKYAHDYDSWTHSMQESVWINKFLTDQKRGRSLEMLDLLNNVESELIVGVSIGRAMIESVLAQAETIFNSKYEPPVVITVDDIPTVVFNCSNTKDVSVLCDRGMVITGAKTAIAYSFLPSGVLFQFRSTEGGLDVGALATTLGGGGRSKTAGAKVSHIHGIHLLSQLYGVKLSGEQVQETTEAPAVSTTDTIATETPATTE